MTGSHRDSLGRKSHGETRSIIGRVNEQAALADVLRETRAGKNQILVLEGETGIGKSRLLDELQQHAGQFKIQCVAAACDTIHISAPYFPWHRILAQLLGVDQLLDQQDRDEHVRRQLEPHAELAKRAPLLNSVVGLSFPETDSSRRLNGPAWADNFFVLVLHVLQNAARQHPLLVVIDDVQWMDPSSWRVARLAVERTQNLSLALAMRPLPDSMPIEMRQVLQLPAVRQVTISGLTRAESIQLAVERLNGSHLSDALADLLFEHSCGNPLVVEQLARWTAERLEAKSDCYDLSSHTDENDRDELPATFHELIESRLATLAEPAREVLKAASVIASAFSIEELTALCAKTCGADQIEHHLETLEQSEFIRRVSDSPRRPLTFQHARMRRIVYELLSDTERHDLHREVAVRCERAEQSGAHDWALLAHHWGAANDPARQIDCFGKAGENALLMDASREAADLLKDAIRHHTDCFGEHPSLDERQRRACWERRLGEAYFCLRNMPVSQTYLEQSLEGFQQPVAHGPQKLPFDTFVQKVMHFVGRFRSASRPDKSDRLSDAESNASLAYQCLADLHDATDDAEIAWNRALHAVKIARRLGDNEHSAAACARLCLIAGSLGFERMAAKSAREAEQAIGSLDPSPTAASASVKLATHYLGRGQWEEARRRIKTAEDIFQKFGDRHGLGEALLVGAMLLFVQGEIRAAELAFEQLAETAGQTEQHVQQAYALLGRGQCSMRRDENDEAMECFRQAAPLVAGNDHRLEDICLPAQSALCRWRLGQHKSALAFAESALAAAARCSLPNPFMLDSLAAVADVYANQCEADSSSQEAIESLKQSCDVMQRLARAYPIAAARSALYDGRLHWLQGDRRRAKQCWQKAINDARRLSLALEESMAKDSIDRYDDP